MPRRPDGGKPQGWSAASRLVREGVLDLLEVFLSVAPAADEVLLMARCEALDDFLGGTFSRRVDRLCGRQDQLCDCRRVDSLRERHESFVYDFVGILEGGRSAVAQRLPGEMPLQRFAIAVIPEGEVRESDLDRPTLSEGGVEVSGRQPLDYSAQPCEGLLVPIDVLTHLWHCIAR
jgi:hypothetical protein